MANLNKISTFAASNTIPHNIFFKIIELTLLPSERYVRGVWSNRYNITYYISYVQHHSIDKQRIGRIARNRQRNGHQGHQIT